MSSSSVATLGSLRLESQYRADMIGNPSITTAEWNSYINKSYKELYDILVAAYGNDYYAATPFTLTMTMNQFYDLPSDFYKLLGVDLQYSASPTGWVTIKRCEFIERNKYAYLQPAVNSYAQTARLWYVPEPTSLIFMPACGTNFNSTTVSMSDVTGITVGMSVDGPGIQDGSTVTAVDTTNNIVVLSQASTLTQPIQTLSFWSDATQIDGISGWEEYIIIDSAIKSGIKQEDPIDDLRIQKAEIKQRITEMAEGRDIGQAHHVSDVLCVNSWGYNQLGAASLRYHLLGNQIMLLPIADSDDTYGFGSGGYGMY